LAGVGEPPAHAAEQEGRRQLGGRLKDRQLPDNHWATPPCFPHVPWCFVCSVNENAPSWHSATLTAGAGGTGAGSGSGPQRLMTGGSVTGQSSGAAVAVSGLIPIAAVVNAHARRNRSTSRW
jgi:hypothetical protein